MAKKFLVNLDLGGNQLLNTRIHNNSGNPTALGAGQLYWDSSISPAAASALKVYTGSAWVSVGTGGGGSGVTTLNSLSGALNIYGSTNQLTVNASSSSITLGLSASTITVGSTSISLGGTSTTLSGLTNVNSTSFVGTFYGAATSITGATSTNTNSTYVVRDANGRTQFTDPSAAQDAATKNYVDTVAQGLNTHDSVTVATTTNLTATYTSGTTDASGGLGIGASLTATGNGILSIDGISPAVNDRILVKNQSTGTQNGIYVVSSSGTAGTPWSLIRAADGDNSIAGEMSVGDFVFVISGTNGAGTGWVLNSATTTGTPAKAIKLGTDTVTYSQFSGQGTYTAGNGIAINGNTFSVLNGTGLAFSSSSLTFASGTTSQSATGVSGGAYTYGTQKQVATITGNNSATSFAINHNLNSRDINVRVYQTSVTPDTQYADVEVDVTRTTASVVTIAFATAVATGDTYNVVITG